MCLWRRLSLFSFVVGLTSGAAAVLVAVVFSFALACPCSIASAEVALEESALKACASPTQGSDDDLRLRRGEVLVELLEQKQVKFVVGRILIEQPPEAVWPILTNPYEFQGKICPRMKSLEVLEDRPERSVLKCSMYVCFFLPTITYVVESKYDPGEQVQFARVGGTLKEFRGAWLLRSRDDGRRTEVLYSMFIDPGMPIPRWIIREGVKAELPRTLIALRNRIDDICKNSQPAEARTIQATASVRSVKPTPLAARKGSI